MVDPFEALDNVQDAYKTYVFTFQKIKNPVIREWVNEKIAEGPLLWKDPYIQLNRRFQQGESLHQLVEKGILHGGVLKVFVTKDAKGKLTDTPIIPYRHQSEAVISILRDNANTIVTTGTSSGKSFCFAIPIVSECLRMRAQSVAGIKALIIYPMNALANSQYQDFAERLEGSGLKIGLYTGDTKNSHEEALAAYKGTWGRDEPYDSELISRDEIQASPPDILMTNYAMLELLLTRFEDRKLFPPEHKGRLMFLVLDEIHTYNGKRGADVACLIRRLKNRTGTIGTLRCIGTSATVQSERGSKAEELIAQFGTNLFGEKIEATNVVGEYYLTLPKSHVDPLPQRVLVTEQMLEEFDGSLGKAVVLTEALTGKAIPDSKRTTEILGKILSSQQTIQFLEDKLAEDSLSLSAIVQEYQKKYRLAANREDCAREIKAALLAGSVGTLTILGIQQPRFVPKVHTFFSQGRTITSCLAREGPHLNDRGESTCTQCAYTGKQSVTFPLNFCRSCGQEFYGVSIGDDNTLLARDIDMTDTEGENAYIFRGKHDQNEVPFPSDWYKEGERELTDRWKESAPKDANYCPKCNKINSTCDCPDKIQVTIVSHPFLFCPVCGVYYDRRPREFNKLFTFGSVGRSTATDVLVSSLVSNLDERERKIIAFSDSRQDTAFQAAHMNNLQKRIQFRRALYLTLISAGYVEDARNALSINESGVRIFDVMASFHVLPEYAKRKGRYVKVTGLDKAYQRYLKYNVVLDLAAPMRRNHQNLEDVGLIKIVYNGLNEIASADSIWGELPPLASLAAEERLDYLSGFLDIFRRRLAIYHEDIIRHRVFEAEVTDKLTDECQFDIGAAAETIIGYSDTARKGGRRIKILRLTSPRSRLKIWTQKSLDVDPETAKNITERVAEILSDEELGPWLVEHEARGYRNIVLGRIYMLNSEIVQLQANKSTKHQVCPKCGTVFHQAALGLCTGASCGSLKEMDFQNNYFRRIYSKPFSETVTIEAHEHSAQIAGDTRRKIESRFRTHDDPLNVLVCTPTLELGIDIGDLSAIYMRNVPPSPSNYAQRAGRAGRKYQPSIVTTFCGIGSSRGPHDQYFYRFPDKIISGRITPPRFMLDNQQLITSHIHSLIFETIQMKLMSGFGKILDVDEDGCPMLPDYKKNLLMSIAEDKAEVLGSVKNAFATEMDGFSWFTPELLERIVDSFVEDFEIALEYWRREYESLLLEHQLLSARQRKERFSQQDRDRMAAISIKLENMREGEKGFYSYRYLSSHGFSPNYGFPATNTVLSLSHSDEDITRYNLIALSEFAPGNTIYYKGDKYLVTYAKPRTRGQKPVRKHMQVCPNCSAALLGERARTSAACPRCGTSLAEVHPNSNAIEMPDMHAWRRTRITSDEEERIRLGYQISTHYEMGPNIQEFHVKGKDGASLTLQYEHNGKIINLNKGTRKSQKVGQENGFVLCSACNRWLFGDNRIKDHLDEKSSQRCPKNATEDDVVRGIWLYTEGTHDVATLTTTSPDTLDPTRTEDYFATLMEALLKGMQIAMDLEEREIDGFVTKREADPSRHEIIIYETAEGGIGSIKSLTESGRFESVIARARELLHENDPTGGCEKACYECLLSYYNQREHEKLDRKLVLPLLAQLEHVQIEEQVSKTRKSRLEELLFTCESELEKTVLTKMFEEEVPLPDQGQYLIYDGDRRVAKTDFYYRSFNIALFVDGPPHDQDYVKKDDEKKRKELKALGYRIFSIHHSDVNWGISELKKGLRM